jgi:putative two-component system response regulator
MARVLVVDDEERNRELLKYLLESDGLQVFTAADGDTALDEFRRCRPDLVLLDIQMPKRDGFSVCKELKAHPDTRLVPVVITTALSASADRILGIECGADDFLIKPIDVTELRARVRSLLNLKAFTDELERAESVLYSLAESIEGKDPYTKGHCERLAEYSALLGNAIGLDPESITALQRAGIVHDIGKVAVPDAVLLKPSRLTAAEMALMQEHPIVGERICAPLKSFRGVLPIIRHHHEKMNGTGYPDHLCGNAIPITARVLQIADVYDALTTERPYKRALSRDEALEIMTEEVTKGWWDADLFLCFHKLTQALPEGVCAATRLRLSAGAH